MANVPVATVTMTLMRTSTILSTVVHCPVAASSIASWVQQAADALAEAEQQLLAALEQSAVMGNDETPRRVVGRWHWEHVSRTDQLTHLASIPSRAKWPWTPLASCRHFMG